MINFCSDMVWKVSIDRLLDEDLFCDDNMQNFREYATLSPHLNYRGTHNNNKKHQLYNGPYKSKSDFYIIYNKVVSIAMERLHVDIVIGYTVWYQHPRIHNVIVIIYNVIHQVQRSLRFIYYFSLIKNENNISKCT